MITTYSPYGCPGDFFFCDTEKKIKLIIDPLPNYFTHNLVIDRQENDILVLIQIEPKHINDITEYVINYQNSFDLVNAFWHFFQNPKMGVVYNIGGTRKNSISILETINFISENYGVTLNHTISDKNREGDHIWYISDVSKFKNDYPNWDYTFSLKETLDDIFKFNKQKNQ